MNKSFLLSSIALLMLSVANAQDKYPESTIQDLVREAIQGSSGHANGWVGGSVAADFNRNVGLSPDAAQPIQVKLNRLERVNPKCARLAFDFSRPGETALAPDGQRYPQRIAWAMNMCTNGMPGVQW
jgi:hypothetical protein